MPKEQSLYVQAMRQSKELYNAWLGLVEEGLDYQNLVLPHELLEADLGDARTFTTICRELDELVEPHIIYPLLSILANLQGLRAIFFELMQDERAKLVQEQYVALETLDELADLFLLDGVFAELKNEDELLQPVETDESVVQLSPRIEDFLNNLDFD